MTTKFQSAFKLLTAAFIAAAVSACGGAPNGTSGTSTGPGTSIDGGLQMGSGLDSEFTLGVIDAEKTSLEASDSITLNVNVVDLNGAAYVRESVTIQFTSNCVAQGISEFSDSRTFTSAGFATTEYTAKGCSGTDVITARADDAAFWELDENGEWHFVNSVVLVATVTLDIEQDTVVALEFMRPGEDEFFLSSGRFLDLDDFNTTLSLPGAGGNQISEITFKVIGTNGGPVIGEIVSFGVTSSVGGIEIVEGRENATSDNDGLVSTVVKPGTVSTTFSVEATHDSTGSATLSDNIVVSSGIAVDSRFSLSVSTFEPEDAMIMDGIEVDVNIIASDFFGNPVPQGTQVFFATPESGSISPSCFLVAGECSVKWQSAGSRPFDGRATIIAYTDGAEDFTDNNGNNVFDASDTAGTDLSEPFVDENENGNYDIGEFFVDTNLNEVWDNGNGEWDGPCLQSSNPAALCDGNSSVTIFKTAVLDMNTLSAP